MSTSKGKGKSKRKSSDFKYKVGGYALSFHGPLLYRAKILKREMKASEPNYFVHYQGWNKKWDEWIIESRMLDENEKNKAYQRELKADSKKSKKTLQSKRGTKRSAAMSPEKKVKRRIRNQKVSSDDEGESDVQELPDILPIPIPSVIKKDLAQDWEMLSRKKILHKLPCTVTVDNLLDKYKAENKQKDKKQRTIVDQIIKGIRDYFNSSCGLTLLYKNEMVQYDEVIGEEKQSKAPATVYGYIHLSRLFVKFPYLLTQTEFRESQRDIIASKLSDFLEWMCQLREKEELKLFKYMDNEHELGVDINSITEEKVKVKEKAKRKTPKRKSSKSGKSAKSGKSRKKTSSN